jgi:hypothetical protein
MDLPPGCKEHLSSGRFEEHLSRGPISSHPRGQRTEIDAGLVKELWAKAGEQSHTEGELLEEIVRSYLARKICKDLGVSPP